MFVWMGEWEAFWKRFWTPWKCWKGAREVQPIYNFTKILNKKKHPQQNNIYNNNDNDNEQNKIAVFQSWQSHSTLGTFPLITLQTNCNIWNVEMMAIIDK